MIYSQLLNNKIEELKNSETIKLQSYHIASAKKKQIVDKYFKKHQLPEQLKFFYYQCNGFFINYYYHNAKSGILSAQISFLQGLTEDKSKIGFNIKLPDAENYFIFEFLSYGNCVIVKEGDNQSLSLYLYSFNKYLNKINLSFEEYVEKTLEYLGIELWQQFYIDNPINISNYYFFNTNYLWLAKERNITFPKKQWDMALQFYRKPLINVKEYIEKCAKDNVHISMTLTIEKPNSIIELMKGQEDLSYQFSDFVQDFFSQVSLLDLKWIYTNKNDQISGSIWIKSIGHILGGVEFDRVPNWNVPNIHIKEIGYYAQDEEEVQKHPFITRLKVLESFIGNSGIVGFIIENEKEKLYLRLLNEMVEFININIEEYLRLNLKLLGERNWRVLLKEKCKRCEEDIEKVFPNFDIHEIKR